MKRGEVVSIAISPKKGMKKHCVQSAFLVADRGIENDAHAEGGLRQVSLLMEESIVKMKESGVSVSYGDFAENIVTRGVDLKSLKIDDRIYIGSETELIVTMIGKTCAAPCRIYYDVGYCIMPEEGVFARVIRGGTVRAGDNIKVLGDDSD